MNVEQYFAHLSDIAISAGLPKVMLVLSVDERREIEEWIKQRGMVTFIMRHERYDKFTIDGVDFYFISAHRLS